MDTEKIELFKEEKESFKNYLTITNQSKMTIESYTQSLKQFFNWAWRRGIDDLREVTKDHIREYQVYLKAYRYVDRWGKIKEPGAYKPQTLCAKLRALRRFFEYLEKTYQILYNPAVIIRMPQLGDRLPKNIITKEEAKKILNAPNTATIIGIRDKTILELFYSTGIRLEELFNLTIYDLDYQNGFLRVNKGKFAKDRVLPLGSICCKYLREYIKKVRPILTKQNKDERALFIGKQGARLNKQIIPRIIKQYVKLAGVTKNVSAHTWRHTFASHLLADGADVIHVQKLLGHSDPGITHIYTRVRPEDTKQTHTKNHPREKDEELIGKPKIDHWTGGKRWRPKYKQTKKRNSNCSAKDTASI